MSSLLIDSYIGKQKWFAARHPTTAKKAWFVKSRYGWVSYYNFMLLVRRKYFLQIPFLYEQFGKKWHSVYENTTLQWFKPVPSTRAEIDKDTSEKKSPVIVKINGKLRIKCCTHFNRSRFLFKHEVHIILFFLYNNLELKDMILSLCLRMSGELIMDWHI